MGRVTIRCSALAAAKLRLRGLEQRSFYLVRDIYVDKPFRRVKVILPTLIYDANISILSRFFIGQNAIYFVQLQRSRVLAIVDADDELLLLYCLSSFSWL